MMMSHLSIVTLSYGQSSSQSNSTATSDTARGSTVKAGGTLTTSDIENKASYEAKSVSVSVSSGGSSMPGQGLSASLSGAGMGKDSGRSSSTTTAGISGIAGDTAKRTGDNAQGIGKIFDADKVRQEIQAQTKITQEFAKQASSTIKSYSDQQKKDLQAQINDKRTNEADKAALKEQLNQVLLEEKVLNILVGAVTGFGETMVTKESLAVAAEQMRAAVNEDSAKFKGVVDSTGKVVLSNQSGESVGVDGDGRKDAGTRVDLDKLCGTDNSRCKTNTDNSLALTDKGQVEFIGAVKTDGTRQTYAEFLQTEDGKKCLMHHLAVNKEARERGCLGSIRRGAQLTNC
jgi:filamentous hemagglutinin